jgi:hypothetical protein
MTAAHWLAFAAFATLLCCGSAAAQAPRSNGDAGPDVVRNTAPDWDINHDGVYTCEEWKIYVTTLFNKADRNQDGYLTGDEFAGLKRADPLFADADLAYFDDNKDGRVSRDEFINKPSPFFQRFDRNHDCKVTPDELAGNKPAEKNRGFGRGGQQRHF